MEKIDTILKLKSKTEQLQSDLDKSRGALERMLAQIKKQYGCESIESAEKVLQSLKRKHKRMIAKRDRTIEEYQQELEDRGNTDEH